MLRHSTQTWCFSFDDGDDTVGGRDDAPNFITSNNSRFTYLCEGAVLFFLVLIDGVLLHLMKKLALFAEDDGVELLFWCD